ncbi:hypothetical protein J6590_090241, partial [Homalodisca vitripennis]
LTWICPAISSKLNDITATASYCPRRPVQRVLSNKDVTFNENLLLLGTQSNSVIAVWGF